MSLKGFPPFKLSLVQKRRDEFLDEAKTQMPVEKSRVRRHSIDVTQGLEGERKQLPGKSPLQIWR